MSCNIEHVITLARSTPPILAMGAWFNNTLCITSGDQAHISKSVGHLDTPDACREHESIARELLGVLGEKPHAIAHDLHPDFHSSRFAAQLAAELDVPLIAVQHHHAHIAAVCAEHHFDQPILGLALDGVGLGTDGTAWGGELLQVGWACACVVRALAPYNHGLPLADAAQPAGLKSDLQKLHGECERIGHLYPLSLPGGDRAANEPWRMAAAVLHELGRNEEIAPRFASQPAAKTVASMLQRHLNCPRTSSMGRVFDAATGLLGLCPVMEFDAQAAITLEQAATRHINTHGMPTALMEGWRVSAEGQLDLLPTLAYLATEKDAERGAAIFHITLIAALANWVTLASQRTGITTIACGGGCFFNKLLNTGLRTQLESSGLTMLTSQKLLPGDTAIALGQAWVASKLFKNT
ncbi:MAG: carbamoyltransferase HypF [Gallionellaceae bacterium]|nr:carbamoyltransferase HypF [Gallionellaceae bacterium]